MIPHSVIKNIRFGLATNSSSTHSIIHAPNLMKSRTNDVEADAPHYGWEFFTLTTEEDKRSYLAASLANKISDDAKLCMVEVLKMNSFGDAATYIEDASIDHQSSMELPNRPGSAKEINLDFFREYSQYLIEGDFAILGGNDNSDGDHVLASEDDGTLSYFDEFNSDDTSYKNGNYWVIQNRNRKLRIQFQGQEPVAAFPELVDVKITDYCDIGCDFCYQDSTDKGIHADEASISTMLQQFLPYGSCTEFAIGGGEPTQSPNFIMLIKSIKRKGGIANFTTKSDKWFNNSDILSAVKESISGIAYSVGTLKEAKKFFELHTDAFYNTSDGTIPHNGKQNLPPAFYLHIIPEIMDQDDIREILAYAEIQNDSYSRYQSEIAITMLGFKSIGRGEGTTVNLIPEIIDIIQRTTSTSIGIDTKFAKDYESILHEKNINPKLYTTEEGEFSMYIDAVQNKAYKSSWHLDQEVELVENTGSRGRTRNRNRNAIFKDIKNISS